MSSSFTCVSGQSRHTTCILPMFIRYCRFETSFSVIFHTQLCTNVQREAKTNSLADPLPIWPYSYHHGEARVAGLRSLPSGWPLYAFVADTDEIPTCDRLSIRVLTQCKDGDLCGVSKGYDSKTYAGPLWPYGCS